MKKLMKLITSVLLTVSMLVPTLPTLASESGDMKPLENLKGLGGNWNFSDPITCNGGGDMFALSDSRAENFIFEADVEFVNRSGAASLVFLSPDSPTHGGYVANIDLSAGNARIFRFNAPGNATTKGEYRLNSAEKAKSTFHLRVEVNGDSMIYFLDGKPIVSITDSSPKSGNRLGLLTYNTSLKYTNVRWAELSDNLPELTSLTGLSTPFSGQTTLKETLPFGTKELKLTATAKNGTLSAKAEGTTVKVEGENITVSDIKGSFDLIIAVTKGDIVRSYVVQVKVEADPATVYNEQWRPQLHFSPYTNWLNDPNGLVYDPSNGTWHLFFQYNPYGLNIANQVWGHAVSTDLMHWKELDIAIPQDSFGAVFSGSAVVDENNTSGFFTDNKPGESKLVALYTSDGGDTTHGVEKQCIAYSKDHGVTWVKPDLKIDKNIVISNKGEPYGRNFRDPKIFWYDGKWFMVIAGGRARLFTSDNLIDWTFACDMGFDSECPDFYPLPVDGDENNIKWVYTASGDWYIIGRLEKVAGSETQYKFVQETARIPYNGGGEVYATQSFYNDGSGANRRIGISWLQDNSADSLSGKTWNGAMSLPHEQTIRTVNGKMILTSYPVAELDELRGKQVADLKDTTVDKVDEALAKNPGKTYDAEIIFKPAANSVVTFTLRQSGANNVQVIYDSAANKLRVVRGRASSASGNIPTGTMEMPLYPDKDGNVTIRIVMDTTVIEVFGNGGEAACTGFIFPDQSAINSSLEVSGTIEVKSFKLWRMTSIWHKGEEVLPASGIYFDAPTSLSLNEEVTIYTYLINGKGERVDGATWGDVDSALATVSAKEGGKLTLTGKTEGTLVLLASAGDKQKRLVLTIAETGFNTNLEGWTSAGDWYEGENGWTLSGSNGDSFTFSTVTHDGEFTYSGVADFGGKGGCLGLVFGATNPASPKSGTWYGANVDTHGGNPVIKLFCNTNGNETWNQTLAIAKANTYQLTVTYKDNTLTYTVNGESVSRQVRNLKSGTLGLVSWNGGGSFNNVVYSDGTEVPPPVTEDPVNPPVTDDKPISTDKPTEPSAPVTTVPIDDPAETPSKEEAPSNLLPILIGVGAVAVIGAVVAVVIVKKKK